MSHDLAMNDSLDKIFTMGRSYFYAFVSFVIITVFSVIYYSLIDLSDSSYITHDSIHYGTLSKKYCDDPIEPYRNAVKDIGFGGFNWVTIVSVGSVACAISKDYSDEIVVVSNIVILALTLILYSRMISRLDYSVLWVRLFYLFFVVQLFLYIDMVSLNKEIYSFFVVSLFLYLFTENKKITLFLFGLMLSLIKIQFLLISIILLLRLHGVRFRYIIVGVSIALPAINWFYSPTFLNPEIYYSRYENIRTAGLAIALNEVSLYPLGYTVAFPLKVIITFLSGFSPMRLFAIDSAREFAYQFNALLLAIVGLGVVVRYFMRGANLNIKVMQFLLIYSLVICLLPYFQLRYFFPVFPLLLMLIVNRKSNVLYFKEAAI